MIRGEHGSLMSFSKEEGREYRVLLRLYSDRWFFRAPILRHSLGSRVPFLGIYESRWVLTLNLRVANGDKRLAQ